jgi:hypothetical protein
MRLLKRCVFFIIRVAQLNEIIGSEANSSLGRCSAYCVLVDCLSLHIQESRLGLGRNGTHYGKSN